MKIIYGITKANFGGAQRYVLALAQYAKTQGHNVRVIAGEGSILPDRLREFGIPFDRITNLSRDVSIFEDIRTFRTLITYFTKEKPDIVHLNSSKLGGIGAVAARVAGVPAIIYTAHGFGFTEIRPWWQTILIKIASWVTVLLSTFTIDITTDSYNKVRSWPGLNAKLRLIPNGIPFHIHLPSKTQARQSITESISADGLINQDTFLIGMLAELTKNKRVDLVIKALSQIDHADTVVVVYGEGELRQELEAKIKKYQLASRVHLAGFVVNGEMLLPGFDLFVLSSEKEGFPYAILEAGRARVPIVATNVGAVSEMLGDTAIIVPPNNATALSEAFSTMKEDAAARTLYAEQAHKRLSQRYDIKQMTEKTSEVYAEALAMSKFRN